MNTRNFFQNKNPANKEILLTNYRRWNYRVPGWWKRQQTKFPKSDHKQRNLPPHDYKSISI